MSAHWARGARFDLTALHDGLTQLESPRAERATALLLDTISIASLAIVGAGLIALAVFRQRYDLALACALLLGGAPLTAEVAKLVLKPRANVPARLDHSFPSGHATIALAIGLAVVLVTPPALRLVAAAAAALYASAIGAALVIAGWHFPSDVAGGFCIAAAWAAAAALVAGRPLETRLPMRLVLAIGLCVAAAGVVALQIHPGIVVRAQLHLRLVEAVFGIAVVATACVAAFGYAIAARSASTTRS